MLREVGGQRKTEATRTLTWWSAEKRSIFRSVKEGETPQRKGGVICLRKQGRDFWPLDSRTGQKSAHLVHDAYDADLVAVTTLPVDISLSTDDDADDDSDSDVQSDASDDDEGSEGMDVYEEDDLDIGPNDDNGLRTQLTDDFNAIASFGYQPGFIPLSSNESVLSVGVKVYSPIILAQKFA